MERHTERLSERTVTKGTETETTKTVKTEAEGIETKVQ